MNIFNVLSLYLILNVISCSPILFGYNTWFKTLAKSNETISVELAAPVLPARLVFDELQVFLLRIDLENKDSESIKIYVAKGSNSAKDIKISSQKVYLLESLKVHSGVDFYMTFWTPNIQQAIPEDGGNDFFLLVSKPSWWGWYEDVVFASNYFSIEPYKQRQQYRFQFQE